MKLRGGTRYRNPLFLFSSVSPRISRVVPVSLQKENSSGVSVHWYTITIKPVNEPGYGEDFVKAPAISEEGLGVGTNLTHKITVAANTLDRTPGKCIWHSGLPNWRRHTSNQEGCEGCIGPDIPDRSSARQRTWMRRPPSMASRRSTGCVCWRGLGTWRAKGCGSRLAAPNMVSGQIRVTG